MSLLSVTACKKKEESKPAQETGTITDIDGNVYKTVKIGNQWWMAEDLMTRRFRDGSYITQLQSDSLTWSEDTIGAYCDNRDSHQDLVGRFYNWYAVNNTKGLAPSGWHIPSDEEWKTLEMYLGIDPSEINKTSWRGTDQGEKLKVESPQCWIPYGAIWSTNESGFTALAGGCRMFNGGWGTPGLYASGYWWTSSSYQAGESWYRNLDYKSPMVFRSHSKVNYGFSVRCVKD